MLEEAVRSETSAPAETAALVLQFLQHELPSGSVAAEERFLGLFAPLCERFFGVLLGASSRYQHASGGWLAAATPWSRSTHSTQSQHHRPSSTFTQTTNFSNDYSSSTTLHKLGAGVHVHLPHARSSSSSSNTLDQDPVVQLLGTALASFRTATRPDTTIHNPLGGRRSNEREPRDQASLPPTLLEVLARETAHRPGVAFRFPLPALPVRLQKAWRQACWQAAASGNNGSSSGSHQNDDNIGRLLGVVLHKSPSEQTEILQILPSSSLQFSAAGRGAGIASPTSSNALRMSPRGLETQSGTPRHAPAASNNNNISAPLPLTAAEEHNVPHVLLSMLEYYLLLFVRFPFFAPPSDKKTSGSSSKEHYGEMMYHELFRYYVRYFIPHLASATPQQQPQSNAWSRRSNDPLLSLALQHRQSECFLRLVVALWLEAPVRLLYTDKVSKLWNDRRQRHLGTSSHSTLPKLSDSYDFVVCKGRTTFNNLPPLVLKSVRMLVVHALADPAGKENITSVPNPDLTLAVQILQLPVYNLVRAALRSASLHARESNFYAMLDLWLLWLEPWNIKSQPTSLGPASTTTSTRTYSPASATQRPMGQVQQQQQSTSSTARRFFTPAASERSNHISNWEAYIAGNLFLYLVPLALFLRRARELDFSPAHFERSMRVVRRVLRVYSPPVLQVINSCLQEVEKLSTDNGRSEEKTPTRLGRLVQAHWERLGPYAPPLSNLALESCREDMRTMLEEAHSQHFKHVRELDWLEKLGAKLEGFFGLGVVSGEEKSLHTVVEQAKLVVGVPANEDLISDAVRKPVAEPKGVAKAQASNRESLLRKSDRAADGHLSDEGRAQLVYGEAKMSPADVIYRGDSLRARPRTYEIDWLVPVTIAFTDWLNEQVLGRSRVKEATGIGKERAFRFNFRFLADYRNLFWILLLTYIYMKIW